MKKKILLICKENSSLSFYNSLEKLSQDFIIDVLFFMPHEDEKTYHRILFKDNKYINKIYSTNSLIEKYFLLKKRGIKPNILNLKNLEKSFKDFKNIRMQLNASQKFSTYFHDRDIYKDTSNNDQLVIYEIYYKEILKVINESSPEYIFDNDSGELRTIIYELSRQKNIPYITLGLSYYKEFCIPNFNQFSGPDEWLIKKVENNTVSDNEDFQPPNEFTYAYAEDIYRHFSLRPYVFFREFYYFIKSFIKLSYPPPFGAKHLPRNLLNFKTLFNKIIIKYFINFSENIDIKNEKFIIFPLHVSPEGSTFTISPLFLNETFIIELISNCLPVDFKLVLKEHPGMIGQRALSFYKKIQKLPNVIFLHPFSKYKINELIENSSAVVTISGTSGMEALMLNRPAIVFAKTFYSFLDGCYVFKDITRFKLDLDNILNQKNLLSNDKLVKYISTVKRYGKHINLTIINSINKFPKEIVNKNIDNFIEVLKTGIKLSETKSKL